MKPLHRPASVSAPFDEAVEVHAHEAFMRTLGPAIAAAAEWHTRREDGLEAKEEEAFQHWLAADPAHGAAYGKLTGSYLAVCSLPPEVVAHLRPPAAADANLRREPPMPDQHPRRRHTAEGGRKFAWSWFFPHPTGLAAACVVAIAFGFGWYQWHQPTFIDRYATARGERGDVALPDGSELKLDALTGAEVTLYRNRREARLDEGKAMFIVAPDPSKPFRVTAGSARITVVGARFSVRDAASGNGSGVVGVAVEEGKVRVESMLQAEGEAVPVLLTQGQAVQVNGQGHLGAVTATPIGAVAPWRKGLVRFSDTPLSQAIRELERYGPTRLVVLDPKVADLRIGGSFEVARPEELARGLPALLPVQLVPRPDGSRQVVSTR